MEIINDIERELYEQDRNELKSFQKEIMDTFGNRLDKLHIDFVDNNEDLSFADIRLVRRVFDFIKGRL